RSEAPREGNAAMLWDVSSCVVDQGLVVAPLQRMNQVKKVPSLHLHLVTQRRVVKGDHHEGSEQTKAVHVPGQHYHEVPFRRNPLEFVTLNGQDFPKNRIIVLPGEEDVTVFCVDPTKSEPQDGQIHLPLHINAGFTQPELPGHEEGSGDNWQEMHAIDLLQKQDLPKNRIL
ncbi:hypothetical protein J6590_103215, partial [Homalodisca vitripennis]